MRNGGARRIGWFVGIGLLTVAGCDDEAEKHYCEVGVEQGDGYPSACTPEEGCDGDAGVCGSAAIGHAMGVCSIPCEEDGDCAVDLPCTAVGRCNLIDQTTGQRLCAYTCEVEADCPINMTCATYSDLSLCYPNL